MCQCWGKSGSIVYRNSLNALRKSTFLDKLSSLWSVLKVSVRNYHQSYIHQSAGLRRIWVQSETYTEAHVGCGGDWEKWSFISVPGTHICGACVHVYIMIIESQLATLHRFNSLSLSSWSCVVEDSWTMASLNSPPPSLPTLHPSHLLSHQTWPSETDCRPALSVCCGFGKWQRGDM